MNHPIWASASVTFNLLLCLWTSSRTRSSEDQVVIFTLYFGVHHQNLNSDRLSCEYAWIYWHRNIFFRILFLLLRVTCACMTSQSEESRSCQWNYPTNYPQKCVTSLQQHFDDPFNPVSHTRHCMIFIFSKIKKFQIENYNSS